VFHGGSDYAVNTGLVSAQDTKLQFEVANSGVGEEQLLRMDAKEEVEANFPVVVDVR
jgi:hypothetical protein